ncbi:MAG: response regulator [Candidatus Electryonea clarkiae]|nr:response regulator [Candidatus Electryonea clarkiae]MDP8285072.1 response regulator [Candidatus Electryonea clarkiae]
MDNKGRILIVDDERDITDFLSAFFRMKDYESEVAHSGQEALEKLEAFKPHIILLDVRMPNMDGIETLRQLRMKDTEVGVIMVTAVQEISIGREALKLGAADFVTKPIDLEYLETTVMVKIINVMS